MIWWGSTGQIGANHFLPLPIYPMFKQMEDGVDAQVAVSKLSAPLQPVSDTANLRNNVSEMAFGCVADKKSH